jgi:hypothetical protein
MVKSRWVKWFRDEYGEIYKVLGFRLTKKNLNDLWKERKKLKKGETVRDLHLKLVAKKEHQRELRRRRKLKEIPIEVPEVRHEYGDYFFLKDRLEANVLPDTKIKIDFPFFVYEGTIANFDITSVKRTGDDYFADFGDESGYWRTADIFDVALKAWVVIDGVVYFTDIEVTLVEGYEEMISEIVGRFIK